MTDQGTAARSIADEQGDLLVALAEVEEHADDTWLARARGALNDLVRAGRPFTTDDLWAELDRLGVPAPREPRAMGAVTSGAARDGRIVKTREYVNSVRPGCHARPIPVWRPA